MLGITGLAEGQGRSNYYNVETPVVSPLTIARLGGHDYLLVCNTPDHSVEVWDTQEGIPDRFVARIPVGLEPNSILWDAARSRMYTTDFLSDSVSCVILTSSAAGFSYTVVVTEKVGNEPTSVCLTPNGLALAVTFKGNSAVGFFNPLTLQPVSSGPGIPSPTDRVILSDSVTNSLGTATMAIKHPRAVASLGDQLFVLGLQGGIDNVDNPTVFDYDLHVRNLVTGNVTSLSGLGSSNHNFDFDSNGDLWVVGAEALFDVLGEPSLQVSTTGFVESTIYRVVNPGAGNGVATIHRRDLNELPSGAAVGFNQALAQPTDVQVFDDGGTMRIFIAAMGSDRIGVMTPVNPADTDTWTFDYIDIAPVGSSVRSGPRAFALKAANPVDPFDPGARLYVLNRLDHSVSTIDPFTATTVTTPLSTVALDHDPTPSNIIAGRPFLYRADLSGNGFSSCSSCHLDGRTDAIAWDLSTPPGQEPSLPIGFIDSPQGIDILGLRDFLRDGFNSNKGHMVTQSLQGLLNFEVDPESQDLFTNAPYHWRGDRGDFTKFDAAFDGLLGGSVLGGPEMDLFEEFINSIHYPPNPRQPQERVFSGVFDSGGVTSTLAQKGMQLYHETPIPSFTCSQRSCVHCHALPIGSNLRFTEFLGNDPEGPQILETAALRGLFQKDRLLQSDGYDLGTTATGMFGMAHTGGRPSINGFINLFTLPFGTGPIRDVAQFVHELDWGTGPMVGQVVTATYVNGTTTSAQLAKMETQVQLANCGLAGRGLLQGTLRGFRYDPVLDRYLEEGQAGTFTRAQILTMVSGLRDRLVFIATPLGSERRVATPSGQPTALPLQSPTNLELLPMITNTAYRDVPTMNENWEALIDLDGDGTPDIGSFDWNHPDNLVTPLFPRSIRQFQYGLVQDGQGAYGMTALRHEAARRFRVAGENIQPGAQLRLSFPQDTSGAPPDTAATTPDPQKTRTIRLEIYPTGQVTEGGIPIWVTVVEASPLFYLMLMNGGPEAPGITATLTDYAANRPEPPTLGTFNPNLYNWHFIRVENPGGQGTDLGWAQLSLE